MFITPDYIHEPLYVITAIFNPIRYKSRYKHYERFAKHVKDAGAILYTIEASFGERHHALAEGESYTATVLPQKAPTAETTFIETRSAEPHKYIKVTTSHELWVKENLLNIAISNLPPTAKYIAFVDADVQFSRPNWVGETIHQLQHYQVVQMFSDVQDVGPHYNPIQNHKGFMWCFHNGIPKGRNFSNHYYQPARKVGEANMWHPGFAWAWRRGALDAVGRLIDWAILGAADNHMAHALIGRVKESVHPDMHASYKAKLMEWQNQADKHIRHNVGFVSGLLIHYWHGEKKNRQYWNRWNILVRNKYNPSIDIKYDIQGVLQLNDRNNRRSIQLRDEIRQYFRQRNEDDVPSVDL